MKQKVPMLFCRKGFSWKVSRRFFIQWREWHVYKWREKTKENVPRKLGCYSTCIKINDD